MGLQSFHPLQMDLRRMALQSHQLGYPLQLAPQSHQLGFPLQLAPQSHRLEYPPRKGLRWLALQSHPLVRLQ
ncbi:unnamed protein product [Periconia digitata]|uniref:Uncharacterized protein n=1 Tax=Periconia digitata TaxID=1303443 RepID=A0A9W4UQR5_9PLEO|nr:unnamed protein product [Periconia digitata]